jgi:hypothetical protein
MVSLYPMAEALDVCSHECLFKERAHRRANHHRLIRIDVRAKQDKPGRTDRSGRS